MMPLNWWFEWKKWDLINSSNEDISKDKKWQGFLAGIVTAMLTPGLVGNFIGRSIYSDKSNRPDIIFLTLLANLAQFIVSLMFGLIALCFLKLTPFSIPFLNVIIPTVLVLCVGVVFFLFAGRPWRFMAKFIPAIQLIESHSKLKAPFFVWSVLRHCVFTVQFALSLYAFGARVSLDLFFWIWQVYLFVTLVPSVFMGKVVVRDSIAVFVLSFAGVGMQNVEIFAASFSIWVINLFIPLLIALTLLRSKSYVDNADI